MSLANEVALLTPHTCSPGALFVVVVVAVACGLWLVAVTCISAALSALITLSAPQMCNSLLTLVARRALVEGRRYLYVVEADCRALSIAASQVQVGEDESDDDFAIGV